MDKEPASGPPIKSYYGGKSLHSQSHGESFWSLFNNRLYGNGLYILDEPEAALSPARQLQALVRIHELVQHESQFIIATHSPILLAYPNAKIYQITNGILEEVVYKETEHYKITHAFLNKPEKMLDELFKT